MAWSKFTRPRFSLRALLAFVTAFMLWGGYHTNRSWQERAAEQILNERGLTCVHDPLSDARNWRKCCWTTYRRIVRFAWREKFVSRVEGHAELTPEVVAALSALPNLESLSIWSKLPRTISRLRIELEWAWYEEERLYRQLPPGAISQILSQRRIVELSFRNCMLTDDDCRVISGHPHLSTLRVVESQYSETGFTALSTMPRLRVFDYLGSSMNGKTLDSIPDVSRELTPSAPLFIPDA